MPQQQQTELKSAYIPPLTCKCGGSAMLIRTILQPSESGVGELRIFQCYACREKMETLVQPSRP